MPFDVLVLGGYGAVGKAVSRLLLKETGVNVVVAGRREKKAVDFANALKREFSETRVGYRYAEASDGQSLSSAFRGIGLVVVTATTPQYVDVIARAALTAQCDYLDILVSQSIVPILSGLSSSIHDAGRVFITQAGFHPGLPAVFIRRAAAWFDVYQKAIVSMAMNARFDRPESAHEIVCAVGETRAQIFQDGAWRTATYKDAKKVDFGPPFGIKKCFPLQMEEIKPLPRAFGLKETGVYVAGFNGFVDNVVFPLIMLTHRFCNPQKTGFLEKLLKWGVDNFSPPEQRVVFRVDTEGQKTGTFVTGGLVAEHEDPVFFTAAPVVACLKQYLQGRLNNPGVYLMGNAVDEIQLLEDMKTMGIQIRAYFT